MATKKRLPKLRIKATMTKDTITLVLDKQMAVVRREKHTEQFEKLSGLLKTKRGPRVVENTFQEYLTLAKVDNGEIVEGKESPIVQSNDYTGRVKLRNTDNYLPVDVLKKLQELENANSEDLLSILKFWYKLDNNPSANSRQQLFRFISMNNIPITEEGDIIMEKGIEKKGTMLLDAYTKRIDNSIGRVVSMDRAKVNDDPRQTCSTGLHCAPPDYVRKWYSGTIIKVLVNPADVVSVPIDYDSRKVRVCKYQVIGYSKHSTTPLAGGSVVKLSDLIESDEVMSRSAKRKTKGKVEKHVLESDSEMVGGIPDFGSMKAGEIIAYVKEHYNQDIILNIKNKKGIVKKATQFAQTVKVKEHFEEKSVIAKVVKRVKTISLPTTVVDLIKVAKDRLNENISRIDGKKANKKQLTAEFIRVFEGAGYKIVE